MPYIALEAALAACLLVAQQLAYCHPGSGVFASSGLSIRPHHIQRLAHVDRQSYHYREQKEKSFA